MLAPGTHGDSSSACADTGYSDVEVQPCMLIPVCAKNNDRMSSFNQIEVECPSCRTRQDIRIWQAIDAARNKEVREQLITGRINYLYCSSCQFEGEIAAPLLYYDTEKRFCARYVPVEYLDDEEYVARTFMPDGTVRAGGFADEDPSLDTDYFRHAHIVFSLPELIRYVLFRERVSQLSPPISGGEP